MLGVLTREEGISDYLSLDRGRDQLLLFTAATTAYIYCDLRKVSVRWGQFVWIFLSDLPSGWFLFGDSIIIIIIINVYQVLYIICVSQNGILYIGGCDQLGNVTVMECLGIPLKDRPASYAGIFWLDKFLSSFLKLAKCCCQ